MLKQAICAFCDLIQEESLASYLPLVASKNYFQRMLPFSLFLSCLFISNGEVRILKFNIAFIASMTLSNQFDTNFIFFYSLIISKLLRLPVI